MKVLVIGSGGREHALVWKLAESPRVDKIFCAPGNAGIAQIAECVPIAVEAVEQLADFVQREGVDLTVVGPEAALLSGVVDEFEKRGLRIFGPRREAALIEGSKSFAKDLMMELGVPTAKYQTFTQMEPALQYIREQGAPIVVKADGLAAGKGVIVAQTVTEAEDAVRSIMEAKEFGEAGSQVVIEEFLAGEEATVLAFVDGQTVRLMVPSQDHKQVFDGDKGPNTGGMGTYAPVSKVSAKLLKEVETTIIRPVVDGLAAKGTPYKGVLYAGLMLTAQGPKVIEFNARFGDPETQVVLPLLENDLVEVAEAVIEGRLGEVELSWKNGAAVCVILAAQGYPGSYRKGDVITGLDHLPEQVAVFHAGTAAKDGQLVTNGGRVLGVTGFGHDLKAAKEAAYRGVEAIHFEGMHYRTDISDKAFRS
ncbi:phosphoribosylamine--glycine ligase [Effusibacillus lacus]|uniref:Phosphoribosylamine--glycine ligase n=1 Tax=Effusibacillus lacus TaxID=1348429 RepID=A0A292YJS5_9BACL|nr:phosphoribosylamine--glycine ligase [Effusibacillus lacus]TCS74285.1 phosphoribosylamine--glycine ligase [Effusibacillus lacus]GAX88745.1 phosphoribosylamine--glycine ligase [Effusibacillus lacus]